jgi:pimeloyl-ACP methyl ester carboxylesterase
VVAVHGWGGNRADLLPLARLLHERGVHTVLIDARCHGDSDDDTYAALPRFAQDLEAALDWSREQPTLRGTGRVLAGHSVGAAAALLAAARRPEVRGVIALAPFAHPRWLMERFFRAHHVPAFLIPAALRYIEWVIGHRFDEIAPVHTVRRIRVPVLLVHGEHDRVVPPSDARAIADGLSHVRLSLIPQAGHGLRLDPETGAALLDPFLDDLDADS